MAQVLKEEVKNAIFESAKNQFIKSDYEACSMRKIASGAGVTVGNLYRYFDNKESLYRELIDDVVKEIDGIIRSSSDGLLSFRYSMTKANFPSEFQRDGKMATRVLNDLSETMILLMEHYRAETMILLKTADIVELYDDFSLIQWIADIFEVVFELEHAAYHLAFGIVKGLESIVGLNLSPEDTRVRATELLEFIAKIER